MNCELYQHDLLAAPEPGAPLPDVAAHLEGCPACRELQRRLVSIERQVRLLPVPASDARQHFLQRILNEPLPGRDTLPLRRPVWRRLALGTACAAAVAAVIVVGAMVGGWLSPSPDGTQQPVAKGADKTSSAQAAAGTGPGPKVPRSRRKFMADSGGKLKSPRASPPSGPLAERLMEYDLRLASADTREERLDLLADLAGTLQKESRTLSHASAPDVLDALARMYTKVIGAGVMARAVDDLPGNPAPADALRQFQSNQQLIQALVDAGLRLAEEEDTFKRAATCNGLAAHLAQEIQNAAANKDGARVTLLGRYLQIMLNGVARNVRRARSSLPAGSPREKEAQQIGQEMARFLQPLPEALNAGVGSQAEPVLLAIAQARAAVEDAIQTMNPAPPPPRNKLPGRKKPGAQRP